MRKKCNINIPSEKNICYLQIHFEFWQELCGVIQQQEQITKHLFENIAVCCSGTTFCLFIVDVTIHKTNTRK